MANTLVIILSETREYELTFDNFKKNVIDELDADLCVCIGVKPDYNYDNPFYKLAKYKFTYNEPEDFGDAFNYAYNIILNNNTVNENHKHWREFLKIKKQFLGGIKDENNEHPGSAGILIFFRWFLLKNLIENDLIDKYERFIITRSDFIYTLPHPKAELMDEEYIWIPDEEHYGGYTDRHVVLSNKTIESYLNILNNMVIYSNEYFNKMKFYNNWNLEQLIKFHLEQNKVAHLIKDMPYIMYLIRSKTGQTRWTSGIRNEKLGYDIKYFNEINKALIYKSMFDKQNIIIDEFYKNIKLYKDPFINKIPKNY